MNVLILAAVCGEPQRETELICIRQQLLVMWQQRRRSDRLNERQLNRVPRKASYRQAGQTATFSFLLPSSFWTFPQRAATANDWFMAINSGEQVCTASCPSWLKPFAFLCAWDQHQLCHPLSLHQYDDFPSLLEHYPLLEYPFNFPSASPNSALGSEVGTEGVKQPPAAERVAQFAQLCVLWCRACVLSCAQTHALPEATPVAASPPLRKWESSDLIRDCVCLAVCLSVWTLSR